MNRLVGGEPLSVLRGNACAICWRPLFNATRYRQTLDEVSRDLCSGCATRMFPVLPPELRDKVGDNPNIIHLDAAKLLGGV